MVFTIRALVEVLGYPEDYVNQVTENVIKKLKSEAGIKVEKEKINKAEKVKERIHASLIEVELKVNDFTALINFCYDYLPSSIELIDTEKIALSAREFTNGLNDMLGKLHQYNMTVSNLINQLEESQKIKLGEFQLNDMDQDQIDLTKK